MKLVVTEFLSLDGVMQAPGAPEEDTSGGFDQGGWFVPFFDEAMGEIITSRIERADALLFGRGTYQIMAAHWPKVDDAVATVFNRVPKYLVSTTMDSGDWAETTVIGDHVVERISALKAQPGRELQVHGCAGLVQTLLKHGLVDEFRLWICPVVLGRGKRLFGSGAQPAGLRLVESVTTATGAMFAVLQPTGAPAHGSFALPD